MAISTVNYPALYTDGPIYKTSCFVCINYFLWSVPADILVNKYFEHLPHSSHVNKWPYFINPTYVWPLVCTVCTVYVFFFWNIKFWIFIKKLFKNWSQCLEQSKDAYHTRTLYKCKPLFGRSISIKENPPHKNIFSRFIFV